MRADLAQDLQLGLKAAAIGMMAMAAVACIADKGGSPVPPGSGAIPLRPMVLHLKAQAAYDDANLWLRVRWPGDEGARDRMFRYVGGAWRLEGGGFRDLEASNDGDPDRGELGHVSAFAEDQLAVAIDDRQAATRVRDFDKFGCFPACHERERQMPNWRGGDGDVGMFLFPTFGGFADLWVWRAQRTGLAGKADDLSLTTTGLVPDPGRAGWTDLELAGGAPPMVFDGTGSGAWAVPFTQATSSGPYSFGDGSVPGAVAVPYATAIGGGWVPAEDDTVPAQILTLSTGSRADVSASSSWTAAGGWDLVLSRKLATGDAAHDVAIAPGRSYGLSFSLHSDQADGRDHYVSLPVLLLVGTAGNGIAAVQTTGAPDFSDETAFPVSDVPLVLPGVTSFDFLVGAVSNRDGTQREHDVVHGGHLEVTTSARHCTECHRITGDDPVPSYENAGELQRIVLRRAGVYDPTPFFEGTP